MDIAPADLAAEYVHAANRWPVIRHTELAYGLPAFCLFAVGSRETNLDPIYTQGTVGDNGHGHGVWQYDDRSHTIPAGFDRDIVQQAKTAAGMLASLIGQVGEQGAYDEYNSGRPVDSATTGGDYGSDVLGRRLWLVEHYGEHMIWGRDGATLDEQVSDGRLSMIRQWWLMYHSDQELTVQAQGAALSNWRQKGGDDTEAGIRDGRWG